MLAKSYNNAVLSAALFLGEDTTNPDADAYGIFENERNHATAVSSILVYAAEYVEFRPSEQTPKNLVLTLNQFADKIDQSSAFISQGKSKARVNLDGSLTQFERVIREEASDGNDHERALVARTLRDLIPGYVVNQDVVDPWTLNLVTIQKRANDNEVTVTISRLDIELDVDESKSTSIPKQEIEVYTTVYRADAKFLHERAKDLAKEIGIVRVRDTIDFFTSPKVENEDDDLEAILQKKKSQIFLNQGGRRTRYSW